MGLVLLQELRHSTAGLKQEKSIYLIVYVVVIQFVFDDFNFVKNFVTFLALNKRSNVSQYL